MDLHEELIVEYENKISSCKYEDIDKVQKKFNKRFSKSVGFVDILQKNEFYTTTDKNGKEIINSSPLGEPKIVWDVNLEDGAITVDDQHMAEIISIIAQTQARQKRMEVKIDKILERLG